MGNLSDFQSVFRKCDFKELPRYDLITSNATTCLSPERRGNISKESINKRKCILLKYM